MFLTNAIRRLLSRQDWVYLLSLLIPFVIYNLALRGLIIRASFYQGKIELSTNDTVVALIYLMRSEIFFNVAYALLWIGLFAAAKKPPLRWAVVVLFHATTILVMTISMSAYQYFKQTGATLDYRIIALYLPRFREIMQYGVINSASLSALVFLAVAISYMAVGPWVLTRFVGQWRGWLERPLSTETPRAIPFFLVPVMLGLLALVFGSLSVGNGAHLPEAMTWRFSYSFTRGGFVNVAVTAAEAIKSGDSADVSVEPLPPARLLPTSAFERRNVVVIVLESTRAPSVTPYNKDLRTTRFLNELAKSSLLAEQAYTIVPWSSRAQVAINCGVAPNPGYAVFGALPEAEPGGIPTQCLADLLKDEGYKTGFFMPASRHFENFAGLVRNFGYEDFYSIESMDTEGFEVVAYRPGDTYEEAAMLEPSEQWLEKHEDRPFLATYHTTTPHHGYIVPKRYGEKRYADDETLNRYLNTLRYQDFFLKNLFDQYKKLGLYEDTVFVLLGDHGEGFGEHGLYAHGNIPYEEGLRIPLIIHDPKHFQKGVELKDPVTQLDILPTIADLLGYRIAGGGYQGTSLLRPLPEGRTLMFSCWLERTCLASLKGSTKYIYHYGNQPDEIYDLSKDPFEKQNLVDERGEEVDGRRNELLEWSSRAAAFYSSQQGK